jgi:hypothetical protein
MFRVLLLPLLLTVSVPYYSPDAAIVGALARPAYIPAGGPQKREIAPADRLRRGGALLKRQETDCWYVLSIRLVCSSVCPLNNLLTYLCPILHTFSYKQLIKKLAMSSYRSDGCPYGYYCTEVNGQTGCCPWDTDCSGEIAVF